MDSKLRRGLIAGAAIAALAGGGAAIAGAAAGGEDEGGADDGSGQPISGSALDRASSAALAETGGGTVTDTEVGDEEGYYEVEVTLDDGSQVDVHLDRAFNALGSESDGDEDG
jgi:uncharacterized membrane protein YkoI